MDRIVAVFLVMAFAGCTQSKTGLLIMAHGGDEQWNKEVRSVVAPLRAHQPVEIAFGMAQTSTLRHAVEQLESQGVHRIVVVRMFISGESFLDATEYIFGLRTEPPKEDHSAHLANGNHGGTGAGQCPAHAQPHEGKSTAALASHDKVHDGGHVMEPPRPIPIKAQIVLSRDGVADSPLVDDILIERVRALSREPARESVLIVGHGPADDGENERWLEKMRQRTRGIPKIGHFRDVRCETLREDWPEKRAPAEERIRSFVEQGSRNGGRVIVLPFRVAGFGPYREILQGLEFVSDGRGFCPHPNMTRWIEQTARMCGVEIGALALAPGQISSNRAVK